MKRSLRLIALTGALGLTSWLAGGKYAEAYPYPLCSSFEGKSCSAYGVGTTFSCWLLYARPNPGRCRCEDVVRPGEPNPAWHCTPDWA
jgi:hypothetical protein